MMAGVAKIAALVLLAAAPAALYFASTSAPEADMADTVRDSVRPVPAIRDGITGTVTRVIDGDTIDIDNTRIRLALVDTPERGEPGHAEAAAFTESVCPVGSVAVYDADDGQRGGSYGRTIAQVWCGSEPLNGMLVDAGHAEISERFCKHSEFRDDMWAKESC